MNNSNNLLISIFSGATETRSLEFKEGFNWDAQESKKLREELIKAILAMSNTPNGGAIILGIRTDTKKKKIFSDGLFLKDAGSFTKNHEHIKTIVYGYCQRPIDFEIKNERHPDNKDKWFVVFQVSEFSKWPTVTIKQGKAIEENRKTKVIENHVIYTRSKLAQWSSKKAGPQELEDIIEIAVKKYDAHIQSLGYTKNRPRDKEIENWFSVHQKQALAGLEKLKIQAHMEVKAKFVNSNADFKKVELRDAARESTIPTFGWPIAVFLDEKNEYRPVVNTNGIKAEIAIKKSILDNNKTYDYWALHTSGAFYILKSIFEDMRNPKIISFNTRIVRITEVFMYLRNLYSKLGIETNKDFEITIKHGGIKGRQLNTLSPNRLMFEGYITNEEEITMKISTNINQFNKDPSGIVEKFTEPLFEIFNFFKLERKILEEVVENYLNGKVI